MRRRFKDVEVRYIMKNYSEKTGKKVAAQMFFLYGIRRSAESIRRKYNKEKLKIDNIKIEDNLKKTWKSNKLLSNFIPADKRNIAIKSKTIVHALTATETCFADLARWIGVHVDILLEDNRTGGIPDERAASVRAFFIEKGVKI